MANDFELPAVFCAAEVSTIKDDLKTQLTARRKNLTVNMAKVERIDTLGLQLLVSLQSSCQAKGGILTLTNVPDSVADSALLLGLSTLIEG